MIHKLAASVTAVVFLLISVSARPAPAAPQNKAEQEIVQLERDWCTAMTKKDTTILSRILADDYTGVSSRSTKLSTKADDLADLKSVDTIAVCVDRDIRVRVYGDAAVATGQGSRSGTYKGAAFRDRQVIWTDTFVRRDGRWQCVASHGSIIGPPQK